MTNLIIIGAPRSGTNMLRDTLTTLPGFGSWPCDEINYIWRHGNLFHSSDEFTPDLATPSVKKYIREAFLSAQEECKAKVLVEKTCANSLRVPFVDAVIPDAKYIFIVRDGIDVVGSAKIRWRSELDIPYLLRKVRFVPKLDLPIYAIRYLWIRIFRLFSRDKRLASWGPVLNNMDVLLETRPLDEVCAIQWQRCVDAATDAFKNMENNRIYRLSYEDFVTNPEERLREISRFSGVKVSDSIIHNAVKEISVKNVGKGRMALDKASKERLETLVESTLQRHNYIRGAND